MNRIRKKMQLLYRCSRKNWPMFLVAASGLVVLCTGIWPSIHPGDIFPTAVLTATLVAVIWYTYETRELRLNQERDTELRHHPWINIERKKSIWDRGTDTLATKERFPFMVQNLGTTPAYKLKVKGNWRVTGNAGSDDFEGNIKHDLGTILPGMKRDFEVIITYELVSKISVDFEVSYQSWQGGGGRFRYVYNLIQDENNCQETEQCDKVVIWLSDDTEISSPVSLGKK